MSLLLLLVVLMINLLTMSTATFAKACSSSTALDCTKTKINIIVCGSVPTQQSCDRSYTISLIIEHDKSQVTICWWLTNYGCCESKYFSRVFFNREITVTNNIIS